MESISFKFVISLSSPSMLGSNIAKSLVCSIVNIKRPVFVASGELYNFLAL